MMYTKNLLKPDKLYEFVIYRYLETFNSERN